MLCGIGMQMVIYHGGLRGDKAKEEPLCRSEMDCWARGSKLKRGELVPSEERG